MNKLTFYVCIEPADPSVGIMSDETIAIEVSETPDCEPWVLEDRNKMKDFLAEFYGVNRKYVYDDIDCREAEAAEMDER